MNWGNKLLLAFLVFGAMIGFLVYKAVTTNFELVEKEYYKSELRYQEVIDGTDRANLLSAPIELKQTAEGINLRLPMEMKNKKLSGVVWFYCAYDAKKDRKIELNTNQDGVQVVTAGTLLPANYIVKISWEDAGKKYYTEKSLTIL